MIKSENEKNKIFGILKQYVKDLLYYINESPNQIKISQHLLLYYFFVSITNKKNGMYNFVLRLIQITEKLNEFIYDRDVYKYLEFTN